MKRWTKKQLPLLRWSIYLFVWFFMCVLKSQLFFFCASLLSFCFFCFLFLIEEKEAGLQPWGDPLPSVWSEEIRLFLELHLVVVSLPAWTHKRWSGQEIQEDDGKIQSFKVRPFWWLSDSISLSTIIFLFISSEIKILKSVIQALKSWDTLTTTTL